HRPDPHAVRLHVRWRLRRLRAGSCVRALLGARLLLRGLPRSADQRGRRLEEIPVGYHRVRAGAIVRAAPTRAHQASLLGSGRRQGRAARYARRTLRPGKCESQRGSAMQCKGIVQGNVVILEEGIYLPDSLRVTVTVEQEGQQEPAEVTDEEL